MSISVCSACLKLADSPLRFTWAILRSQNSSPLLSNVQRHLSKCEKQRANDLGHRTLQVHHRRISSSSDGAFARRVCAVSPLPLVRFLLSFSFRTLASRIWPLFNEIARRSSAAFVAIFAQPNLSETTRTVQSDTKQAKHGETDPLASAQFIIQTEFIPSFSAFKLAKLKKVKSLSLLVWFEFIQQYNVIRHFFRLSIFPFNIMQAFDLMLVT